MTACPNPALRTYLLAELRCAALRHRLAASDIDAIGVALAHDWITSYEAIEEAALAGGLLRFIGTLPPKPESAT
jgi:hypothetical protein